MAEGDIIVGDYELRNCVATGNVSQIWECVERGGSQHFAMKLLLEEAFAESVNKTTLKHEYKVGASLEHPNFLRFYKIEVNRDHAFFIMDYFRAPSLKSQIASDPVGVQIRFKKLVEAVTQAIGSMHEKGWLHRDIKPENILMNKGSEVRLIDFSLSTRKSSSLGKLLGGKMKQVQGTRTYIAPETLKKQRPTEQTDMYSLGVTLYEALAGHPPFRGMSPNDLLKKHMLEKPAEPSFTNPNITPECDAFILHMLRKNPKDRPADMKELYAEFRNIKIFKEDPEVLAERKREEAEKERLETVDQRLDSRVDAERSAQGIAAPAKRKKKKKGRLLKDVKKEEEAAKAAAGQSTPAAPAAPAQPAPPAPYPPQQMPGYMPQQPMPYPQAGYYPPQQPMYPQHPAPYQMPAQQMPPGYPPQQLPPQQMPPQPAPGYPQQPMPPQQPPQQAPPQPAPAQPPQQQQPPAPQPPAPQPPAQPQEQPRHRLPLERPQAPAVPTELANDLDEFTDLSEINME